MGHSTRFSLTGRKIRMSPNSCLFFAFLLLPCVFASSPIRVHVDGNDRLLCGLSTQQTCSSACQVALCTDTCIATCGLFSRRYSYVCSSIQSNCVTGSAVQNDQGVILS